MRSMCLTQRVSLMLLLSVASVSAGPPLNPLPRTDFSWSRNSPATQSNIGGRDIVRTLGSAPDQFPFVVAAPGQALGLVEPADELDAISTAHATLNPMQTFAVVFSVDSQSRGVRRQDPLLVALGLPFNVFDQAGKNQAAGDMYMALQLATLDPQPLANVTAPTESVLVRNQYNEGGPDYVSTPIATAAETADPMPVDDVDATEDFLDPNNASAPSAALDMVVPVYFSASSDSPSVFLGLLPGGTAAASGATIYLNPAVDIGNPGMSGRLEVYARFDELGLVRDDDIDALIVFDDLDGAFGAGDYVIFSLAPGSPSLAVLPGAAIPGRAANIYIMKSTASGPRLLLGAPDLGLGFTTDNINALDFFLCDDALACAEERGVRFRLGDTNCDNLVNAADIDSFVVAVTQPENYPLFFPQCDVLQADTNRDGKTNAGDIDGFVDLVVTGG